METNRKWYLYEYDEDESTFCFSRFRECNEDVYAVNNIMLQ